MKHACICELINKSFTFTNFHQININNHDYDDCVDYIEFEKRSASII